MTSSSRNGITRAFITGASSGIGEALALRLAAPGVQLGLVARREGLLRDVGRRCEERGASVLVVVGDVRDERRMAATAEVYLRDVGVPDTVIANAGIRVAEPPDGADPSAVSENMQTNFQGLVHTFAPFLHPMIAARTGRPVAISSIGSIRATPNSGAYSASKVAVNLWTEALRLRLIPHHVSVTTIRLGFVRTAMTADLSFRMPGILSATQAAEDIVRAAEGGAREVTLPWQARLIWDTLGNLPDPLYDRLMLAAARAWPKRNDR